MIQYCEPNVTFSQIWFNHGISHCFLDTVSAIVYTTWLILFGLVKWRMYCKYATQIEPYQQPKSALFGFQIFLSVLMLLECITRTIIQITLINAGAVYGYIIFALICNVICWPLSVRLMCLERRYMLPSVPAAGHGVTLLVFWALIFINENLAFVNLHNDAWWFDLSNLADKLNFSLFIVRYSCAAVLFILGIKAPGIPTAQTLSALRRRESDPELREPILGNASSEESTWRNVWKKMKVLVPYMWPQKSFALQLNVLFCFFLLIVGRIVNVYVPQYYKLIVNSLGGDGSKPRFCWDYVLIYIVLKFLQGAATGGFLNNLRSFLWISVQQYTSREVQVGLFAHLHSLSLRWHLGRKTGEVLRIMDRGTTSINQLLSYIIFNILPTVLDIMIAVVFFSVSFNYYYGIIVFVTMALYLIATIVVTEWRTQFRRSMNLADNELRAKGVDSLLNFETVKYYGAEDYEVGRYTDSLLAYQSEEWKSNASLCFLNSAQNLVINFGLLVGSMLAAWMVANDEFGFTVGDYVLFASYILQLYAPLNWFGTYYRMIQQSFIDMENMFDLLKEEQEVKDKPSAILLEVPQGKLEFKNVHFHYNPDKPILKGISFKVDPGQTVAIVGPSGEGKSTIVRLIFRFYDVASGAIIVDGFNVNEYTQKTLRNAIGVVPQDTVLFNDTIQYNIRYGNVKATDEEVESAATYADIHKKILTFPDQYDTKVGERGLKLSGGEKQRVAIARTILKNPTFILLDEATSALDTQTERNIQAALNLVCSHRTSLIIAHRLSTIVNADVILVLKDGLIVEQGRHDDLLAQAGVYADMWRQQLEANNNAVDEGNNSAAQV